MPLICLHNVVDGPIDRFDWKCSRVPAAEFEAFVNVVAGAGLLLPFSEWRRRLGTGTLDDRSVALTFDDGFRGVHRHALPRLRARGIDAAVFVSPPFVEDPARVFHFLEIEAAFRLTERREVRLGCLDGAVELSTEGLRVQAMKRVKLALKTAPEERRAGWHRELLAVLDVDAGRIREWAAGQERCALMGAAELKELTAAGWTVGAHGLTHRSLGQLPLAEAREEIFGSKAGLGCLLGAPVELFAYPYGEPVHVGEAAPALCREAGYRAAFTTVPGPAAGADPFRLPRVDFKEYARLESGADASISPLAFR